MRNRREFYWGRIFHQFYRLEEAFTSGPRSRVLARSIRIGATADRTTAYIDLLGDPQTGIGRKKSFNGTQENRKNDLGQPQFPMWIKIAGDGRYSSPFFLNTRVGFEQKCTFMGFKYILTLHKHDSQRETTIFTIELLLYPYYSLPPFFYIFMKLWI